MSTAYVLINCDMGTEGSVINEIRSIAGVKSVNGVFGAYDIIVEVQTPTIDNLRETITMKIRKLEGVRTTLTLMAIEY
ncbi:MAG TPA: Lrp/AsnC family transcriptional regulator [Nitrosopumilaceae archaeon]|nr:Lrp/AsnC family transcriptional regulator [Nitrosopumilaceae archaeon]